MSIVDFHVHFGVAGMKLTESYEDVYGKEKWDLVQRMNEEQRARWRQAWRFPIPDAPLEDYHDTARLWLKEMDENDISHMVFVTAGNNEIAADIQKIAPNRFVCFAHHDICEPDAAEQLEHAITDLGLRGYKLLGPELSKPLDDKSLEPVWKVAEKHRIPILIHFGILGGAGGTAKHVNMSPMIIHDVAKAHPEIPFVVPHFGCGEVRDTLFLCWACPNVHIDTSGSNQWTRWMPYSLTVKDLYRKYYETIGPKRILFGTDSGWFPRGFVKQYFDSQMRDCVEIGMKNEDIDLIFSENAKRLLKIKD